MYPLRMLLLIVFGLLVASNLYAQDDCSAIYDNPCICNKGSIAVSVAAASEIGGWFTTEWSVQGWMNVSPGECKNLNHVVWHGIEDYPNSELLTFAFTDSTGVWGSVKFGEPANWTASDKKMCVGAKDSWFNYEVDGKDPSASCKGYVVPAAIRSEGKYIGFNVGLKAEDRATPIGPQASSSNPPPPFGGTGAGGDDGVKALAGILKSLAEAAEVDRTTNIAAFFNIVGDSINGPGAPTLTRKACIAPVACDHLDVCGPSSLVEGHSWNDPTNVDALKTAVRHYFAANTLDAYVRPNYGGLSVKITETPDHRIAVDEVESCLGNNAKGFTVNWQ